MEHQKMDKSLTSLNKCHILIIMVTLCLWCVVHRFIFKCYNCIIPNGKVIDHINDNRLVNLQLMTPSQNCKKAAQNHNSLVKK